MKSRGCREVNEPRMRYETRLTHRLIIRGIDFTAYLGCLLLSHQLTTFSVY